MSEQALDLRSVMSILSRHRRTLVGAGTLGAVLGLTFVLVHPPLYVSESLILLPQPQVVSGQSMPRDVETEIKIATSEAVLGPAAKTLRPKISAADLARVVDVAPASTDVLQIKASAESGSRAEEISRAVADSAALYATDARNSLGNAERASLDQRQKELRKTLDTINEEIKRAAARRQNENPNSVEGKADASALSQLTAEQANIALQIDQLKTQTAAVIERSGARATVIESAAPGKRVGLVTASLLSALVGLVVALALTALVLVVRARKDHRLRYRDDIADAVGSPVLASLPSRAPDTVAGWTFLLHNYVPGAVETWALRQLLRTAGLRDAPIRTRQDAEGEGVRLRPPLSIAVVSLSDDQRALAVGPQLASHAASVGLRTHLLCARGHESGAALRAACSRKQGEEEVRANLVVRTDCAQLPQVGLNVVVVVVDRQRPDLLQVPETAVTVLAVSSGTATAEDLARTAVAADDAGRRIVGVVVADPDNLDRTTGRLLQTERAEQVPLPRRLTGVTTSASTRTGVSRLPRRPG